MLKNIKVKQQLEPIKQDNLYKNLINQDFL